MPNPYRPEAHTVVPGRIRRPPVIGLRQAETQCSVRALLTIENDGSRHQRLPTSRPRGGIHAGRGQWCVACRRFGILRWRQCSRVMHVHVGSKWFSSEVHHPYATCRTHGMKDRRIGFVHRRWRHFYHLCTPRNADRRGKRSVRCGWCRGRDIGELRWAQHWR